MSGKYILRGHTPVVCSDVEKWAKWFEGSGEKRRVAHDHLSPSSISTIFLGLDHQFGNGPPLLFETMVFGGPFDGLQGRYSTWQEAEDGHAAIVQKIKSQHPKGNNQEKT